MAYAKQKFSLERRAARAFGLKDWKAAASALEDLLAVVGDNPNTLHVLAVCRQRMGELESAIAAARRGIESDADHVSCLKVLVECHVARDEPGVASAYAARALKLLESRGVQPVTFSLRVRRLLRIDPYPTGLSPKEREWMRWARALCESAARVEESDGGK